MTPREELIVRMREAAKGTPHARMVKYEDIVHGYPITRLIHYYEVPFGARPLGNDRFRSFLRSHYETRKLI